MEFIISELKPLEVLFNYKMEYIISEHISNWKYFNILAKVELYFIFDENNLKCLEGNISIEGIIMKKFREGIWILLDNKYNLIRILSFRNDKKNGKCIALYRNGKKCEEIDYINDKMYGKFIMWHEDEQMFIESNYLNDKMHGKTISWYRDGKLWEEKVYENGELLFNI